MASIEIKSANTGGGSGGGNLQLLSGAAMTATPTAVTDTSNTQSILKLSTNLVQINGTLNFPKNYVEGVLNRPNIFITTQNQPDPNNFAVENFFTFSAGTTYVQNGSNPLDVGFGNTYLGLGSSSIADNNTYFNVLIGYASSITANQPGNVVIGNGATSSVANALSIGRGATVSGFNSSAIGYNANTSTTNGFALGNSTSLLQIGGNFVPTARVHAKGTGATSATTSLLIQNSAAATALQVRDDRVVIMPGLPTSSAGLPSGALWNNLGVLNIV